MMDNFYLYKPVKASPNNLNSEPSEIRTKVHRCNTKHVRYVDPNYALAAKQKRY